MNKSEKFQTLYMNQYDKHRSFYLGPKPSSKDVKLMDLILVYLNHFTYILTKLNESAIYFKTLITFFGIISHSINSCLSSSFQFFPHLQYKISNPKFV